MTTLVIKNVDIVLLREQLNLLLNTLERSGESDERIWALYDMLTDAVADYEKVQPKQVLLGAYENGEWAVFEELEGSTTANERDSILEDFQKTFGTHFNFKWTLRENV